MSSTYGIIVNNSYLHSNISKNLLPSSFFFAALCSIVEYTFE
jgi:hypothetical protein